VELVEVVAVAAEAVERAEQLFAGAGLVAHLGLGAEEEIRQGGGA
jgi:hypothetical protein